MDFSRIASYRSVINLIPLIDVCYIHLSEAGFKYMEGESVICEGCGKVVNINDFRHADSRDSHFHNIGCSFVPANAIHLPAQLNQENHLSLPIQGATLMSGDSATAIKDIDHTLEQNPLNLMREDTGQAKELSPCLEELLANDPAPTDGAANAGSGNIIPTYDVEVKSRQQQSALETFDDREIVSPEIETSPHNNSNLEDIRRTCQKNPGHFAYFSPLKLRLEQLPSYTRDNDTLRFLQIFSQLVVRVVCLVGKKDGGHKDGSLEQRVGTGSLSLTDDISECHYAHKHRLGRAVKFVAHLVKKPKWSLFILTSRHLARNNEDAANTQVEFFYDEPSKVGVKSVKAVSMRHSGIVGDNSTVLVCETSDATFVQRISKSRQDALDMASMLPRRAQKSMVKKLFIISHAHGQEKVLSYGDSVAVTYALKVTEKSESRVTEPVKIRCSELGREPLQNLRKALLYAIDTCNGSTGAPLITFSKHHSGGETEDNFHLDVWVHNGVDRVNSLGCSVLKECTEEDLQNLTNPTQALADPLDSDSEKEADTPEYSSVFKVQTSPAHAEFASFKKRLESCANWEFSHIHKPEMISHTGFFYSGYLDCVKCFYCGLGLKTWKPGDDLHREHEKYRPTCAYLKRLDSETLGTESAESSVSTRFETLLLLELENKLLREQFLCKVCHLSPVKDVFLPCGELIACTKCSKLLTHCCSCGKQILATVTTYFS